MEPRVGDTVDVPGGMHGTVKFIGDVAGKKGKFAGVQLAAEFAARGKNSGDVDGKHYFKTTKPGAGIFLPVDKAMRRGPATPLNASLANFNQGGRTPALPKPNFSQSIGPGARAASPAFKPSLRRPSLQRPASPLRQTPAKAAPKLSTPGSRPSVAPGAKNRVGMGSRYGQSPMARPSNFSASLRGATTTTTTTTTTPTRTPLGPEALFDEEADSTPTPTPAHIKTIDHTMKDEEVKRLKQNLEDKDRQLKEQAATLAEMEKSLSELQSLLPSDYGSTGHGRNGSGDSEDVAQMRSIVREKNEKIQVLIAEFDAHRADFRSTIDTLEMASTETERVYEKRVDELLQEVRELQDRGEDVDTVAQQLKQLEELVQELEEGLEDARRGEAEARGEVEFLRGEVERGRSELKREKSKAVAAAAREDGSDSGSNRNSFRDLEAKDDEIRGLKTIIHSLSGNSPAITNGHPNDFRSPSDEQQDNQLQKRVTELERLLSQKSSREEELELELERLRNSTSSSDKHKRSNTLGSHRLSDRTVIPGDWRAQNGAAPSHPPHLETMHEADSRSTATTDSTSALWCEICETSGHDILTCTNMFANGSSGGDGGQQAQPPPAAAAAAAPLTLQANPDRPSISLPPQSPPQTAKGADHDHHDNEDAHHRPAPLRTRPSSSTLATSTSSNNGGSSRPPTAGAQQPSKTPAPTPTLSVSQPPLLQAANPLDQGMVAGKSSGVIDAQKWCALCERDGHESVDCPFEDAF